jgi:hypothetical protein
MIELPDACTTLLSFGALSCLWMMVETGEVGVALDVVMRIVVDDENCDELFEL